MLILTLGSFDSVSFNSKNEPDMKMKNFLSYFDKFLKKKPKKFGKLIILTVGSSDTIFFDLKIEPYLKIKNFLSHFDQFHRKC